MAPKYMTPEWLEELKKRTAADKDYLSKAKDLTFESIYIVNGCPEGVDRRTMWKLDKGVLVDYTFEEKKSPAGFLDEPWDQKKYFYRISGNYETYVKMNSKEITAMQALSQKVYKIDGPMMKIMSLMGGITAQADLMSSIECEY